MAAGREFLLSAVKSSVVHADDSLGDGHVALSIYLLTINTNSYLSVYSKVDYTSVFNRDFSKKPVTHLNYVFLN